MDKTVLQPQWFIFFKKNLRLFDQVLLCICFHAREEQNNLWNQENNIKLKNSSITKKYTLQNPLHLLELLHFSLLLSSHYINM